MRWLKRLMLAGVLHGWLALSMSALAQDVSAEPGHSIVQGVAQPLWPAEAPLAQGTAESDVPALTTYLPLENTTRTAVVIAPGGGYQNLATEKEGTLVAQWLNARGVAAFVLRYRLGPKYHYPVELNDAQRALRTVRWEAASLGIDPRRIGMWGFSAGGHLAAMTGTLFDAGDASAKDAIERESSRPDFLVLAYPVITMDAAFTHGGSRSNLLGAEPSVALVAKLSTEKQVSSRTPPTFLFATSDDDVVPVRNSVAFYTAMVQAKVPVEMHLFAHGPHGTGLAQGYPELKVWPELLAGWMRANGWMAPAE